MIIRVHGCYRYGDFICGDGKCIPGSQKCDGIKNCKDNSDEARCTYLRSGDTIALKSSCGGGFIGCYRTDKWSWKTCSLQNCPGQHMSGKDWTKCRGEVFNHITVVGKNSGDAIRYGDKIAIRYISKTGDKGWWLSCHRNGATCKTRTCPGKYFSSSEERSCGGEMFWIYSVQRRGSCSTDTYSSCRGKPLYPGDEVYILNEKVSRGTAYWLSGCRMKKEVKTSTCSTRFLDPRKRSCRSEKWQIYRR